MPRTYIKSARLQKELAFQTNKSSIKNHHHLDFIIKGSCCLCVSVVPQRERAAPPTMKRKVCKNLQARLRE